MGRMTNSRVGSMQNLDEAPKATSQDAGARAPQAVGGATEGGPSLDDGATATGALQVIVVEDDEHVRSHTTRTVAALGYAVRAAADAAEALRLLSGDLRCDLLLTDVVMPGMSGGQLAEAARLLLPNLPVVFVTGNNADPIVERLRREGSAVVLAKPYRRAALAEALQSAFRCA